MRFLIVPPLFRPRQTCLSQFPHKPTSDDYEHCNGILLTGSTNNFATERPSDSNSKASPIFPIRHCRHACDNAVQPTHAESGNSKWRPVKRKCKYIYNGNIKQRNSQGFGYTSVTLDAPVTTLTVFIGSHSRDR